MKNIIIFDQKCLMCSKTVAFLTKRESGDFFEYVSYHSPKGVDLLKSLAIDFSYEQYIVYIKGDGKRVFKRSDAVIEIVADLGGWWSLARAALIIPKSVRDWAYNRVAKNRKTLKYEESQES